MKCKLIVAISALLFISCSSSRQIARSARETVVKNKALADAHVGICIYEPATGKYIYNYQGDKFFVPASNTKIPTCYAAMKYLGDSLVGLRYAIPNDEKLQNNFLILDLCGDPTFLHDDYSWQPVFDSLKQKWRNENRQLGILFKNNNIKRWGSGWGWSDYQESYMAERSPFPVHGNVVNISLNDLKQRVYIDSMSISGSRQVKQGTVFKVNPGYFDTILRYHLVNTDSIASDRLGVEVYRNIGENEFRVSLNLSGVRKAVLPYVTNSFYTSLRILADTLKVKPDWNWVHYNGNNGYSWDLQDGEVLKMHVDNWNTIHSQPTDSMLKPMMHRSDNFFAEQSLLMVSNQKLGFMNDSRIIDTILKSDLKDLPQPPVWVDGSGLSRYNLFTPQDLVLILAKMQSEFGMDRVKEILATGGEGTLSNYYKSVRGFIFAKTGTLSGVVALSGFLYTKKNRLLIFSVLVNNHRSSTVEVRRAVEKFIIDLREDN